MALLGRTRRFFGKDIWSADLTTLSPPRRMCYLLLRGVGLAIRGFSKHNTSVWASSLTYVTLLTLVPFVALVVLIGANLGVSGRAVDVLAHQIPPNQLKIIEGAVETLQEMDLRAIGAAAVLALLFAVVRMLVRVEKAFNKVWGLGQGRSFSRRLVNYAFVTVIVPLFVLAAMAASAAIMSSSFVQWMEGHSVGGWLVETAFVLLPYIAVMLALLTLYWMMPNTKVRPGAAFTGAFVAAILWLALQKGYFALQVVISKWGAVYGAFAALPMFLIWVYLSWLIVIFGSEIAYGAQHASAYAFERGEVMLSQAAKEKTALRIVLLMASRFEKGEGPLDADGISLALEVPARLGNRILAVLKDQGIVSGLEDGKAQIARSPALITAADVVRGLRREGESLHVAVDVPAGALAAINDLTSQSLETLNRPLTEILSELE